MWGALGFSLGCQLHKSICWCKPLSMIFSINYIVSGICVRLSCFQVVPVMERRGKLRCIVVFVVKEEQFLGVPLLDG